MSWSYCRNGCALGGLCAISLHVKLKCAKLFVNSSTILFLNVRSELEVAFSQATVFWTEISLKWHMWFILVKSLTLKIRIPNSLIFFFFFLGRGGQLTTVFHGVQGLPMKNKTSSYAPGNTVTVSTEVSCTLEANNHRATKEIPFFVWNLKFHCSVHKSLLVLAIVWTLVEWKNFWMRSWIWCAWVRVVM